jgi:ketosteroid isomerase-like protein
MKRIALPLACAGLVACTTLAPGYADPSLENLFNAERAFASDAYTQGIRASFLHYLAPDAIVFQPGPVRYADAVKQRPPPTDPRAAVLEWGPQAGAVSRAGDLGFTTGPWRLRQRNDSTAPASYGYYLSVWSRAGGEWRVIVDAGVTQKSPPPQEGAPNMRTPIFRGHDLLRSDAQRAAGREKLLVLDRMPRAFGEGSAGTPAYRDLLTPVTRFLKNDEPMLTGEALIDAIAEQPAGRVEWMPIDGAIAASDDLAYTYGKSRRTGATMPAAGYYVHVWQRNFEGAWKLIAEVSLPAS